MKYLSVLILVASAFAQFQQTGNYTITGLASTSTVDTPSTPVVTTTSCPSGTQAVAYARCFLAASGGTQVSGGYCWSVSTGALPTGLSLGTGTLAAGKCTTSGTGIISGTPSLVGVSPFTVTVTDANGLTASQDLSITINASATLTLQSSTLSGASIGASYSATLPATGGVTPYQSCSITSGALPAGITISVTNGATPGCALSSSNVTAGAATYNFTAQIKDNASPQNAASQSYSIVVTSGPPLTYSAPMCVQNNAPPYTGNCAAWPITTIPYVGGLTGKALCYNDPNTGYKVMRLTDSSLSTQNIHNADSGLDPTLNADDSMTFVSLAPSGVDYILPFDFTACTVGTPIPIKATDNGYYAWDFTNRITFYDLALSSTVMKKCTVNTSNNSYTCNPLFDYADNTGSAPHGSGGLLPGYASQYIASAAEASSIFDNNGTFNPGHTWAAIYAGGPPWSQNGPYGTTWQVNQVVRPPNTGHNNTGKNSFRATACSGSCVGAATEPNWDASCTTTCTDGNITWTNIGQHNGQDLPFDYVMYDTVANCFTHLDLILGRVMNTNCSGQATGALTYLDTGTTTTKGAHAGGSTPNSSYMDWDYGGSYRYIWSPGTMTVDYCIAPANFCAGHDVFGQRGWYASSSGVRLHPYANINSGSTYPVLFNPGGAHKYTYINVNSNDTTPICSYTTNAGHYNLNYTTPFYTEIDCFATDGSTDTWRMFQAYNSNIHWSYHVQDSGVQTSATGTHILITTDFEGTLGSDKGHNTCTAGQAGCASNTTTGDTCIQGGDGWQLSTAYTGGTVVNPGTIISTSGFPQASGNTGHYAFKALNTGTSSATNSITWCQTPPTAWGAGNGCTTVDNNITWQNIGQIDCRGDVFVGALTNQQEDMATWMLMRDRTTSYMSGSNSQGSWKDADGQKLWHVKCGSNCSRGYPWDLRTYDNNRINWWITDNSFTLDPSAYKRFVTPVPLVPRFLTPGTTFDTGEIPGPNTIKINAGQIATGAGWSCTGSETSTNLGHIHGVTSGPTNTTWTITNVGTVTLPTMEVDYYWGGTNGNSVYNTRERYFFAKPYGLLQWDTGSWNGSGYTVNQTSTFTTYNNNAGSATPQFTCSDQSWWIGGQPGSGGNAP